jgi:hypothetical protein
VGPARWAGTPSAFSADGKPLRTHAFRKRGLRKVPQMILVRWTRTGPPARAVPHPPNMTAMPWHRLARHWFAVNFVKQTHEPRTLVRELRFSPSLMECAQISFGIDGRGASHSCSVMAWR